MAKSKTTADPTKDALNALSRCVADSTPKPLYGSAKSPGIFMGTTKKTKAAAAFCAERGWLELTGEQVLSGRTKKDLYQATQTGIQFAIENAEHAVLLRDMLNTLDQQRAQLMAMNKDLSHATDICDAQIRAIAELKATLNNRPESTVGNQQSNDSRLASKMVDYLRAYKRDHPFDDCPLPKLYKSVADSSELTIGTFHDVIRLLVRENRLQLHPYTGALYELEDEDYALVSGKGIQYYVGLGND